MMLNATNDKFYWCVHDLLWENLSKRKGQYISILKLFFANHVLIERPERKLEFVEDHLFQVNLGFVKVSLGGKEWFSRWASPCWEEVGLGNSSGWEVVFVKNFGAMRCNTNCLCIWEAKKTGFRVDIK